MKDYFYRISHGCKKWELVYWWILRATMIFAMVDAAVGLGRFGFGIEEAVNIQQVLQTFANLVGMFAWEICLLFSKKRWPRYVTPLFQDGLILLLWLASFGGAYINFYYSVNSYDYIMHAALGFWAVIIGYEIATSMQKRDKTVTDVPVMLLCAFGFSFVVGTGWELFEFTFDQVAGGDSQHWSQSLAVWAAEKYNNPGLAKPWIFDPTSYAPRLKETMDGTLLYNSVEEVYNARYAVIDTMEDIIFNTVGAVAAYIFLRIKPYNHKGKKDVNKEFEVKTEKRETVNAK